VDQPRDKPNPAPQEQSGHDPHGSAQSATRVQFEFDVHVDANPASHEQFDFGSHHQPDPISRQPFQHDANWPREDPEPVAAGPDAIDVCADSPIPHGYIKTNDHWDPTKCGSPSSIVPNVWTLTRYIDKPVGTTMDVCAGATVPPGWVVVGAQWNPTACGQPSGIVDNVQQIQRVS
jgi:hypothetical protein